VPAVVEEAHIAATIVARVAVAIKEAWFGSNATSRCLGAAAPFRVT